MQTELIDFREDPQGRKQPAATELRPLDPRRRPLRVEGCLPEHPHPLAPEQAEYVVVPDRRQHHVDAEPQPPLPVRAAPAYLCSSHSLEQNHRPRRPLNLQAHEIPETPNIMYASQNNRR